MISRNQIKNNVVALSVLVAVGGGMQTSCNKTSKSSYMPVNEPAMAKANVVVVDSAAYTLASTALDLSAGTYIYTYNQTLAGLRHNGDFLPNTILVGTTGNGYLRKVVSVSNDDNKIVVKTVAAKLEDVFQQADFSIANDISILNLDFLAQSGLSYNIAPLYVADGTSILANRATFAAVAKWNYNFSYKAGVLSQFSSATDNATVLNDLVLSIRSTNSTTVNKVDSSLISSSNKIVQVGKIPLLVRTETYLRYSINGTIGAGTDNTVVSFSRDTFSAAKQYNSGSWMATNNARSVGTVTASVNGDYGSTALDINAGLKQVVMICGIPTASISMPLKHAITSNANGADKDLSITQTFAPEISDMAYVYGYTPKEQVARFQSATNSVSAPYGIQKVAGDNQSGAAGRYLAQPLTVRVVDNAGVGQKNVTVYFRVVSGGGNLAAGTITTDNSGIAQASWQLGAGVPQRVEVTVRKADGSNITGAPVYFTAN
jgi:hypothetical protein